ncbi:MAG: TonB-dependent receptor [Bacteroidales bacterium]|jgi:outer membrane receptor for ferrienterochelin and colicins|nr:TonB-dependent receptor [Bacteroidales bacterium]
MRKSPFSLLFGHLVYLLVYSFLFVGTINGQDLHQQAFIRVIDQNTLEPVAFAHVCFEGMKSGSPRYALTSLEGTVANEVKEISKIAVSYVGYSTFKDTILPGQSLDVKLRLQALNMDEVVVTAQYTPERIDKSIYKVEVINARQIEQKAATNMAELLKDQSNMQVSQDGVLGTSLRIQGLSGENVKFLMDGVPMIGRMNGNFDLNQINLYNVDHVEVIEGPMSVIYGSNALAGVINIITKENKSSLFNAMANTYLESVGVYNFDGSVSFNKNKNGFALDGGRNFFGGYSPVDTSRSQTFKPRRQYFLDGYYTFTTRTFKLKLGADYFNELLVDKGPLLGPYNETAFDNNFTTIRYSVRAETSLQLPHSRFLNLLASWSVYNRIRQTFFKDLTTLNENIVPESWAQDTTTINSIVARGTFAKSNPDKKFNYQLGFDISYESGTGEKISGNRQEAGDYAGFLSVKYDPFKPGPDGREILSIQPGLRVIYNTKYNAPLVYALSVKWGITEGLNLRFSWSRGFRAPALKELYLNFVDVNHDVKGNPNLKAEQSNNFSLNLNYSHEKKKLAWTADITGFFNLIDNVILLAPIGNNLEYTYVNLSKYETTGVQASASFNLLPSFKVQLGLAETGVTGTADPNASFESLKWSTELTAVTSYRFIKPEITLSLFYKYSGRAPQLAFDDKKLVWGWVDPYPMMDFTASKGFWNNRIRFSLSVKNIFNTITIPSTGSADGVHGGGDGGMNISWGRTFFTKLSFQINKYK